MRAVVLAARFLFSANYLKVCYNKPYKTKTEDIMDYSQILSQQFNIKEEYAKNIITSVSYTHLTLPTNREV